MVDRLKKSKLLLGLFWLFLLLLFALLLVFTGRWTRQLELNRIATKAEDSLNVYTGDLLIELDKFEALPFILARNPPFLQLLLDPHNKKNRQAVNAELERINGLAETSAVYIIDARGKTLAASNWNEKVSFIGEDLSFRPYFKQALQGRPGRYYALGNTSKIRGYYFAAPMYSGKKILGVMTVKVLLQRFEDNWAKGFEKVVVTDPQGVIFISSHYPWRFQSLSPLSNDKIRELKRSQRYGDISPQSLSTGAVSSNKNGLHFISLKSGSLPYVKTGNQPRTDQLYLISSQEMTDAGWTVHILSDISHVEIQVRNVVLLVAFLLVILFLSGALLYNKRQSGLKQKEIELQAHEVLQELNAQLEHRVQARTQELTLANTHLTREVQERRRTEKALRDTHEELIQAGKLAAIGQMAASITHEISQPLAAIRMYSENSLVLLDENQPDQVRVNLEDITELVVKMSHITTHLKSFARKSKATLESVDLELIIHNVIILLSMELEKSNIDLHNHVRSGVFVLADQLRLEQVFMNVISNALDAIEGSAEKVIEIYAEDQENFIEVSIHDSGSGIQDNDLKSIFEPFFTKKQRGKGLGLGLSLTESIINDFGGRILAENHPEGGAVFRILLKKGLLQSQRNR